jgi:hypothetical protein
MSKDQFLDLSLALGCLFAAFSSEDETGPGKESEHG